MDRRRKRDRFVHGVFAWLRLNAIEKLRSCVGHSDLINYWRILLLGEEYYIVFSQVVEY